MAEKQEGGHVLHLDLRRLLIQLLTLLAGFVAGAVGSTYSWQFLTPYYILKADLAVPGSVHVNDPVQVACVQVGNVWDIGLIPTGDKPVEVSMRIAKKFQPVIRADSTASVGVAGMLGGSYIDITRGSVNQPVLQPGATVRTGDRTAALTCDQIMKAFSEFAGALKNPFGR